MDTKLKVTRQTGTSTVPQRRKKTAGRRRWPDAGQACSMCIDIVRAVGHNLAIFVCVDFHSIGPCPVYESFGEVLKYSIAAARKINVVGES